MVGLGQSKGIIDNVSLKFTVSQEVYLALFQTFGSSRRLQTRGKGQVRAVSKVSSLGSDVCHRAAQQAAAEV